MAVGGRIRIKKSRSSRTLLKMYAKRCQIVTATAAAA